MALWALQALTLVSAALAFGLWLLIVGLDLVMFRWRRRYYEAEPAELRLVGMTGVADTDIEREGTVRIRGELWRARSARAIPAGQTVTVVGVEGLTLVVEDVPASPQEGSFQR